MISHESKQSVLELHRKGCGIREISRMLNISKNTVRRVVREQRRDTVEKTSRYEDVKPFIQELFTPCRGNVVRIQNLLEEN